MKHLRRFNEEISYVEYEATLIGDSIKSILDSWNERPFNDYTIENDRVFINTQEGGDIIEKYKALKSYLKDNFGVESNIKDVGWKTKSTALVFNPNQFVENPMR